jgi:hypothetical protein
MKKTEKMKELKAFIEAVFDNMTRQEKEYFVETVTNRLLEEVAQAED